MDKEQSNKFLSKQPREKIMAMKNPMMIKKFIKIYNGLCKSCRVKVIKFPTMKYKDYCKKCQKMIDGIGGK